MFRWSQSRNSQPFVRRLGKPPKQTQETFIRHLWCSRPCDQFYSYSVSPQTLWNRYALHLQQRLSGHFGDHEPWIISVGFAARGTGCCYHCSHQMVVSAVPESSVCWLLPRRGSLVGWAWSCACVLVASVGFCGFCSCFLQGSHNGIPCPLLNVKGDQRLESL